MQEDHTQLCLLVKTPSKCRHIQYKTQLKRLIAYDQLTYAYGDPEPSALIHF